MNIIIIGKQHIHGTSAKTGKAYDFTDVYFNCRRKGVEGLAGAKKTIGVDILSAKNIVVGAPYDLTLDDEGNVVELTPLDPATKAPAPQNKA